VAANGRNGPVTSDWSGFERKLVRWCRIRPVVSEWSVGFSVGFSQWESRRGSCRADVHNPTGGSEGGATDPGLTIDFSSTHGPTVAAAGSYIYAVTH
jgi:hypothetical protein